MTETPWAGDLRQQADEIRRRYHRQFVARLPATAVLALTGASMYSVCALFGMRWARLAGASKWEAAVWPVAVTATTMLAVYCWVRLVPEMYPSEARWLFGTVATAGFVLASAGNTLYIADLPQQLHPSAATLVKGVPGLCLILSAAMAATFLRASRPPENPFTVPAMFPTAGAEAEPQA
jgi:uncharacterized BrkB/YihY/UPF0761 family membrane protein